MYKEILVDFYRHIGNFNNFEYLLAIIRSQIAPTSKNLKLGTMLNLKNGKRPLKDYYFIYKDFLPQKLDVDFFELSLSQDNVLVYFYNSKRLMRKLKEEKIQKFLNSLGYEKCRTQKDYLQKLKERFTRTCPDEIGIFLGYPLKDVIDFKNKDKKSCKCVGYWKCFNNAENSKKAFERYDKVKYEEIEKIVSSI